MPDSLPLSLLNDYLYCPRRAALKAIEGWWGENEHTVLGSLAHEHADLPPRDRINCLLSFLYALVRHDCVAALTAAGFDPFVGFLHTDRPNRPSLALDLMEEFRPWLADRLAVTLINRQQIGPGDFRDREGGAVEFTEAGRKAVIKAYQERKQDTLAHPLLDQNLRVAQLPFVQARVLARHLRGDVSDYIPFVPK